MNNAYKGEIRDSLIRELLEKTRKLSYETYLASVRLERIRLFNGAQINFNFPVTALIGPNGGGKSTVLGACACVYSAIEPGSIFKKSRIGDESMNDWKIEYEVVDRNANSKGTIRTEVAFQDNTWHRNEGFLRGVKLCSITRTVPAAESPLFTLRKKLSATYVDGPTRKTTTTACEISDIGIIKREAEMVLGKSLASFRLFEITIEFSRSYDDTNRILNIRGKKVLRKVLLEDGSQLITIKYKPKEPEVHSVKQMMYIGSYDKTSYSEFNFGSGESSVIHMIADIESLPDSSLVLIEEIENGLHPLAVRRMVEYLIQVAKRKNIQTVFTTHSDYALAPLPSEAIWACVDGRLQQGKLSIEVLRAVSGRVDKRLAIFVEDDFTRHWVETVLRERLPGTLDEVSIYALQGDGNAVNTHCGHIKNPAVAFHSICFIDGDSKQKEDSEARILRLPGSNPEMTIFNSVLSNIDSNIAILTIACQRPLGKQDAVADAIKKVSQTNRDPHLLFSQVGVKLGFVPEAIVRGAFLSVWVQENSEATDRIAEAVKKALELPPK